MQPPRLYAPLVMAIATGLLLMAKLPNAAMVAWYLTAAQLTWCMHHSPLARRAEGGYSVRVSDHLRAPAGAEQHQHAL